MTNKYPSGKSPYRYQRRKTTCCYSRLGSVKQLFQEKPVAPHGQEAYRCRYNEGWHLRKKRRYRE